MEHIIKVANTDIVGSSDTASWLILKDPIAEIRKAVNDKDYFKTVAYACSIFEYCGKQMILGKSRNEGKPISKKELNKLKLEEVINQLFSRKILTDTNVKSKMHTLENFEMTSFIGIIRSNLLPK